MVNTDRYWAGVVRRLLDGVVSKPNLLKIDTEIIPSSIHVVIVADAECGDQSRVMGKKGRMIDAIDHIAGLGGKAMNQVVKVSLFRENGTRFTVAPMEFQPNVNWDNDDDQAAIDRLTFIGNLAINGEFKVQSFQVTDTAVLVIFTNAEVSEKTLGCFNTLMAPWGWRHGRRITVELKKL